MHNAASAYQRLVTLALTLLGLLAPGYVHAAVSHRTALPFPDRAQHAAQQNLTPHPSDHHLTSNPLPTRRVGARDVGKAAAERRWVGASPAKRVEFVWDGEVLAFELDSETGPRAFVHEPGGFEPILQQQNGETYLCVNDHLGIPKELIDGSGSLAWAAAHSAYGKVIATQGPGELEVEGGFVSGGEPHVESPFRLLGQVNDPDADLTWTRFRCFDAETGTWISTDPLEIAGGLSLYGFDGSPSDVVDPLGLETAGGNHPPKRRKQTEGDVTYETEEEARAEALRRHGATADAPYEATPVYGKNDNLKGPKGEPSERITTINSQGELVEFDHHKNGHFFKDANEYELPHYHGPKGEHISYGTSPYANG